jgi:hypothetical protein
VAKVELDSGKYKTTRTMKRILLLLVGILPLICSCSSDETDDNGVPRDLIGTWMAVKVEDYVFWEKRGEQTYQGEEYIFVFDEHSYKEIEKGEIKRQSAYTYDKKNNAIVMTSDEKPYIVEKLTSSELLLRYDYDYDKGTYETCSLVKSR